jgi:hypothetical protein
MAIPVLGSYIEALSKYGATERAKMAAPSMTASPRLAERQSEIANKKQAQIDAQRLKLQKQQLTTQQRSLKVQQDQAKLRKGQGLLDIEAAGVLAALQGKITDNEKLRLELQLALLTGNAKEADRLSNALLISQAQTTGLASFIANLPKALNPFADYPAYIQMALAELAKLAEAQKNLAKPTAPTATYSPTAGNLMNPFVGDYAKNYGAYAESPFVQYSGNPNPQPYNVQVYIGDTQITDVITKAQMNNSASGIPSTINRLRLGLG